MLKNKEDVKNLRGMLRGDLDPSLISQATIDSLDKIAVVDKETTVLIALYLNAA